jgi:hypothetical protein
MAVAQQLPWIVHNLKAEGARHRQNHHVGHDDNDNDDDDHEQQQRRQGGTSPDGVGFIIAVPTRNAGV